MATLSAAAVNNNPEFQNAIACLAVPLRLHSVNTKGAEKPA